MATPLHGMTILNVNDDPVARQAISQLLLKAGYQVIDAATGTEAEQLMAGRAVDLLVLAQCDGEVARSIKAQPTGIASPILQLTAPGSAIVPEAEACLPEPVDPQMLLGLVKALLRARRAEVELAQAQADAGRCSVELATVFAAAPNPIIIYDRQGIPIQANPATIDAYGYDPTGRPRAETIGKLAISHPDGRPMAVEELPSSPPLRGEYVRGQKLVFTDINGRRCSILASSAPILQDGEVQGAVLSWSDITELEEAQEKLRISEARLRHVLEAGEFGIWGWDVKERRAWRSLRHDQILGYQTLLPEWNYRDFIAHIVPEERQAIDEQFGHALTTHQEWEFECRIRRADGEVRWIWAQGKPKFNEQGEAILMTGLMKDITERKQVEAELEVQRALLETIIENTRAGIAYLDTDFIFRQVNPRFVEFVNLSREELLDQSYFDFFPGEEMRQIFEQVVATREPAEHREMIVTFEGYPKQGTSYWDWRLAPAENERGEVEGLVLSTVNVTHEVENRERLLTAERAQRQLAESLNAEISHRTKNNLAMVAGLLQVETAKQPHPEVVAALRDATARLLTFAQIHEQLQPVNAAGVNLLEIVQQIGQANLTVFSDKKVDIQVEGEPLYYHAKAATNIAVAANELITNAIKHGAPEQCGCVRLKISLARQEGQLRLAVWNSGNPVAADFQVERQTTMGMRLVQGLVAGQFKGSFTLQPWEGGSLAEVLVDETELRRE